MSTAKREPAWQRKRQRMLRDRETAEHRTAPREAAGCWWAVPGLDEATAERIVELSAVDGATLRSVAGAVGTSKDSVARVLAADARRRDPVANLSHSAADGSTAEGAAAGTSDRQRAAETVRLGSGLGAPYPQWTVEVDDDGLVTCPICGKRVSVARALRHTGSIPSGVLLPMGYGMDGDDS